MPLVDAQMLLVVRVYGDGTAKTPTIAPKAGSVEEYVTFLWTQDMTFLGLLSQRPIKVYAAAKRPTPAECQLAAEQQLALWTPAQFTIPNATVLPDYTAAGAFAHTWNEVLHKWVRATTDEFFGAAFELYAGGAPLVRPARVINAGNEVPLGAGALLAVQGQVA